jgi:hypothetical protein
VTSLFEIRAPREPMIAISKATRAQFRAIL